MVGLQIPGAYAPGYLLSSLRDYRNAQHQNFRLGFQQSRFACATDRSNKKASVVFMVFLYRNKFLFPVALEIDRGKFKGGP